MRQPPSKSNLSCWNVFERILHPFNFLCKQSQIIASFINCSHVCERKKGSRNALRIALRFAGSV